MHSELYVNKIIWPKNTGNTDKIYGLLIIKATSAEKTNNIIEKKRNNKIRNKNLRIIRSRLQNHTIL